ncbi:MAG: right-handed parallel beta-helix repeat-containing protein, partial [Planctomycetota bacterium]
MRLTPWLSLFSTSATRSKVTRAQTKRSGRSIIGTLESLEDRIVLTALTTDFYVDDTFVITNDVGAAGLSVGDTVTFANAEAGQTTNLIYGANAFSTIQAAVTAASAGDTVNVAVGTYVESVNVTKSLTIKGANAGIATGFNGGTRGAESVVNGAFDVYSAAVDTTIDGLQITGATVNGGGYHGIRVNSSANNVTIVNNKIYGNNVLTNTQGIEAGAGLGSQVFQNNEIKGFASGIYVNPGSNVQVLGNYIHNVYAAVGNDAVTLLVKNNRIENATEGIGLGGSSSIIVQSNSFDFNTVTTLIAHYSGTNVVDASGNWWGSTDAAAIAAKMLSNGTTGTSKVDFSPYYNSGTDTAPSTPGFQGDVSNLHVTTAGAAGTGLIQEAINLQNGQTPTIVTGTVTVEAGTYTETLSGQVGTLKLGTGAVAQLSGTLTGALDASAGTLVLGITDVLSYEALSVNGTVTLGQSLTLNVGPSLVAMAGTEIILISNDGTDAVTGTFSNYADGAIISTNFGGTGKTARISYTAGDGNDVGIRVDDPVPIIPAPIPGDADPLTPDSFVVTVVGDTLQTTFNGVVIDSRPIDGVDTLTINGNTGSTDTLTVDFSANPALAGLVKIVFNGGGDTHDELIVNGATGGSAMDVSFAGAGQGTIVVTGGPEIDFTGIGNNTLIITGTTDLVLNFAGGDNNIDFTAVDNDTTQVSGASFVTTTFENPTNSLTINFTDSNDYDVDITDLATDFNPTNGITINGGGGVENIAITDLGDSFTGPLVIDLGAGTDVVTFDTNSQSLSSLNIAAETITATTAALMVTGTTTLAAGTTGNITLDNAANNFNSVVVTSGNNVTLVDAGDIDLGASTV